MEGLLPSAPLELPWAADLLTFWKSIPFVYVLAGHCIFVSGMAPEFKGNWLVHFVMTFCWGFGGGMVSAFMIMDPKRAPPALFANNLVGVVWTLCWWAVNYSPGGYLERLSKRWYIVTITKSCTALLRASLIVARVDQANAMYPGVVAAPLLLGTIGGCGGRIIVDAMKFGWGRMPGNAEMSDPGFVSRSAFVAAAVYYGLAHATGLVEPRAAAGLVITALMLQSMLTEPLGRPLDFTQPIADVMHTVCFVPKPSATCAAPAFAAVAAASGAKAPPSPMPTPSKVRRATAVAAVAGGGGADAVSDVTASPAPRASGARADGITKPAARRSTRLADPSKAS